MLGEQIKLRVLLKFVVAVLCIVVYMFKMWVFWNWFCLYYGITTRNSVPYVNALHYGKDPEVTAINYLHIQQQQCSIHSSL